MPRSQTIRAPQSTTKSPSALRKTAPKAARTAKAPRQDFITVTMDESLKRAIAAKAAKSGIPMARAARILLESWVGADLLQAALAGKRDSAKRTAARNAKRTPKRTSRRAA